MDNAEFLRRRARAEAEIRTGFLTAMSAHVSPTPVRFFQVGGNDGQLADPLAPHIKASGWSGVIVEPVPYYFRKLQQLHESRPQVTLVNAACSDAAGELVLWTLKPAAESKYAEWARGLATANPDHFKKHSVDLADCEMIIAPCQSIADMCRDAQIEQLDLLCVDVEGHELAVFRGMNFGNVKTTAVLYERKHLGADEEAEIELILSSNNFTVHRFYQDSIAIDPAHTPALAALLDGAAKGFKVGFL